MPVELIPREILFGNPERTAPSISPDGEMIAFSAPVEGVLNVFVAPRANLAAARAVTSSRNRPVTSFTWVPGSPYLVYILDRNGDEQHHLFRVDVERGGEAVDLTPFENIQAQFVAAGPNRPGTAVVGLNRRDARYHDAFRLDVASGALELAAENEGFMGLGGTWGVDPDLHVLATFRPDLERGGGDVLARARESDPWRVLHHLEPEDELSYSLAGVDDKARVILVTPAGADRARLVAIDIAGGGLEELYSHAEYDVTSVALDPATRAPRLAFTMTDTFELAPLTEAARAELERVRSLVPGVVIPGSADHARRHVAVQQVRSDGPQTYHLVDLLEGTSTELYSDRPALAGYTLAPMEPFRFTASDGLTVHGYLTFPPDAERRDLPAVLQVHGGPWGRDAWGFSPVAQWIANRGYLCVQVDYRGSTGYGKAFVNAADREWAGKMHHDLLEAIDHLAAQRVLDPGRVAIAGGSYGGFAALVGAAFTPERFRCAIAAVGPSNLVTLLQTIPPYWAGMKAIWYQRVGNPETEADFLLSRSPISRVDNISIPVLVAHGANDPRVKQAESEQIVAAMRERGIPHEYLLFPDEGHGFVRPENQQRFRAASERFLAEHLGGRFQPEAEPVLSEAR